jgi:hypothetical protein
MPGRLIFAESQENGFKISTVLRGLPHDNKGMAAAGTANPNTAIGNPGIIEFESGFAFFTLNNHVFYPHKD